MSDCRVPMGGGYPVLKLAVEFDGGDPWMYALALNGRKPKALHASLFPFDEEHVLAFGERRYEAPIEADAGE